MEDYSKDIPLALAIRAHNGTSFSPEVRGRQEVEGYAGTLEQDRANLEKLADTEEKRKLLDTEFTRYREGYRKRYVARLEAHGRCLSSMITGGSNFPTRRNEKANNVEHRRSTEQIEFRAKVLKAIRRKLQPELQPIMSGDADAIERLMTKIEKAEEQHEKFKAVNKIIRKHKKAGLEAQEAALIEFGLGKTMTGLLLENEFGQGQGFPSYELTNGNANIRRMKQRLVQLERNKATPEVEIEGEYARLEDCPADNRIRLFYPGKLDDETRTSLKRNGFRWARSLGCWQAYRNNNSLEIAQTLAGV